ncbi:SDR family NAD(P)-dependent oxidoreductase [Catelliglobosispora koreensis]|uniref:SDR family NAD(P)-dependent oxidoreductase n=1 Tax=Catelliglobosispora koreensis TaxID=129052 RepID=UPI0004775FAF|nr:SDR family oxidoreductase [Catelliglobosispora koreensis]
MRKVTVVTGGSRGIGAATCRQLAAAGHDLVIGYHSEKTAAEQVAADAVSHGVRAVVAQLRLETTTSAEVSVFFDAAAELGPLTGFVNNAAAISRPGPFTELSEADLRRVIDVNVTGAILCLQEAVRRMSGGGAIVNVSSGAATLGSPGEYIHYAASKAALDTVTLGLSKEAGPAGIRVNTVQPGTIKTEIHDRSGMPGRPEITAPGTPLRRAGEPEEIASAIAWLLSDEASYVTGAVLRVAGGR